YVFLGPNRQRDQSSRFPDQSITQLRSSILEPYTAFPFNQFSDLSGTMQDFGLELSNLGLQAASLSVESQIISLRTGQSFASGGIRNENLTVAPYAQPVSVVFDAFGEQALTEVDGYVMESFFPGHNDQSSGNDSLSVTFRIDSLLAYDDGEADAGFGINKPRGFGTQVNLPRPDSLTAVWICFVPQVYLNTINGEVTYLEERPFRVVIWNKPNPDSILTSQAGGMRVQYGEKSNTFIRYPFPAPIAVPETFWIGIQQSDALPIGVGYDLNFDRDDLTFFDNEGQWTSLSFGGALMIRPEFYQEGSLASLDQARPTIIGKPRIFPQPIRQGQGFSVEFPGPTPPVHYQGVLQDLNGRQIATFTLREGNQRVSLPQALASGLYLCIHRWQEADGTWQQVGEKLRVE
ncbi:MAG: hypothetical protein AAF804_03155, partial [Bacteroidota bacterium]